MRNFDGKIAFRPSFHVDRLSPLIDSCNFGHVLFQQSQNTRVDGGGGGGARCCLQTDGRIYNENNAERVFIVAARIIYYECERYNGVLQKYAGNECDTNLMPGRFTFELRTYLPSTDIEFCKFILQRRMCVFEYNINLQNARNASRPFIAPPIYMMTKSKEQHSRYNAFGMGAGVGGAQFVYIRAIFHKPWEQKIIHY